MAEKLRERVEGTLYRDARVTTSAIVDEDARVVDISFSSEEPYLRSSWFDDPWYEVLGHKKNEVDLSRLNTGGTLHYNHRRDRESRLGAVLKASVKDKRGIAQVQFTKHERVDDIWEDVKAGLLTNISVAYKINERVLEKAVVGEPDTYRVTAWEPMEISFVDIPADVTVGMGRGETSEPVRLENHKIVILENTPAEVEVMKKDGDGGRQVPDVDKPVGTVPDDNVTELEQARKIREQAKADKLTGATAEHTRQATIRSALKPFVEILADDYQPLLDGSLADITKSVEDVRAELLVKLGAKDEPVSVITPALEIGHAFRFAVSDAIDMRTRAGGGDTKEEQARPGRDFAGFTMFELARRTLEHGGVKTEGLGRMELVGRAFTGSDFPIILADVANKSMLKGFDEAPETWQIWCQVGSLSDFKTAHRVNLSSFDALAMVREGDEFKYGHFQEEGESIQLGTYGKLFAITRQAIINDDLSVFSRIPAGMGRAASRLVGDLAYGVLTSNPTMSDGKALFHADHNNVAANGEIPSVSSIHAMRVQMGKQTDVSGSVVGLNIRPAYLICPLMLEDTARVIQTSESDPAGAHSRVPNTARGLFETISDPRLDADSATKWYLAASQQYDTIEVAFLDGQQQPTLEQQQGWHVDGTEFKVRQDVAAAPLEYRSWVLNNGA